MNPILKNTMKPVSVYFKWTARRSGGVFFGFKLNFPASIAYPEDDVLDVYRTTYLSFGFLLFAVDIQIRGNKPIERIVL